MKTFFVYDTETKYILSGYECVEDDCSDGYNPFTRPYKYPEFHPEWDTCRMDYIHYLSKSGGLKNLKRENLRVKVVDSPFRVKSIFVKNPHYLDSREATRGWWKLLED